MKWLKYTTYSLCLLALWAIFSPSFSANTYFFYREIYYTNYGYINKAIQRPNGTYWISMHGPVHSCGLASGKEWTNLIKLDSTGSVAAYKNVVENACPRYIEPFAILDFGDRIVTPGLIQGNGWIDPMFMIYDTSLNLLVWKSEQGSSNGSFNAGAILDDENAILVGTVWSSDAWNPYTDALLTKIDKNGNIIWSKFFDPVLVFGSVEAIPGGFIVSGGPRDSNDNFSLYKFDNNGNLQIARSFSNLPLGDGGILEYQWPMINNTHISYNSNSIVVAPRQGRVCSSCGDDCTICLVVDNNYIIKLDMNLNVIWAKHIDNFSTDSMTITGIQVMNDGSIVVMRTGQYYFDSGSFTRRLNILKLNANGNVIWSYIYNPARSDYLNFETGTAGEGSLNITPDGSILAYGSVGQIARGFLLKIRASDGYACIPYQPYNITLSNVNITISSASLNEVSRSLSWNDVTNIAYGGGLQFGGQSCVVTPVSNKENQVRCEKKYIINGNQIIFPDEENEYKIYKIDGSLYRQGKSRIVKLMKGIYIVEYEGKKEKVIIK
jgi:hypothetical protein